MIAGRFVSLKRFLPRRLAIRIMVGMIAIVVSAGIVTTLAINQILAFNLRQQLSNSGRAVTISVGDNLANALLQGNLESIQESLDSAVNSNKDIRYAFAYGPHTPVIYTFQDGFPHDLLSLVGASSSSLFHETLLLTENGLVHDFAYRPLDGVPAEIHLGMSENSILAEQRKVTELVLGLTAIGCILAAGMAYILSRVTTLPLVELTQGVHRLGEGQLEERISLPSNDEVGELAMAFNSMADRIQTTIYRLRVSETGYRVLLSAASEVGEGIAILSQARGEEGKLLFANETFAGLAGFASDELLGMNVASVLSPDSVEAAFQSWTAIRSGTAHSNLAELTLTSRHGERRTVESASTHIEYQDRFAVVWFVRDITERKQREQELRLRNRELAALNAVSTALSEPFSPDILQRGLHEVLQALELDIGWVTLTYSGGESEVAAYEGIDFQSRKVHFPDCQCGEILQTGEPALVSVNARCLLKSSTDAHGTDLRHATVSLGGHGRMVGALCVAFPASRVFGQENLHLLSAIGQQMGIALENSKLWEELQQKEQIRSELLARSLQAQEGERKRIARELHDATGQSLNAILFGLKAMESALESDTPHARMLVARLKSSASDTVRELQSIIYDLRPSILDDLGLVPALHWYAESRLEANGVRVRWDFSDEEHRLPAEIESALFRIGQETITNIRKYANATEVGFRLSFRLDQVTLQVVDNGEGFDVGSVLSQRLEDGRGLGLLGMRERAELLGGDLEIESSIGRGTRVQVKLPVTLQNSEKRLHDEDTHSTGG